MARIRSKPAADALPMSTRSGRQALKETTNTSRRRAPNADAKPSQPRRLRYENDGDLENLVKDAKPRRGRSRKDAPQEPDVTMMGGLGDRMSESARHLSSSTARDSTVNRERLAKKAPSTIRSSLRKRGTREITPSETQQDVLARMKERMETTAQAQRSPSISNRVVSTDMKEAREAIGQDDPSEHAPLNDSVSLSPTPPRAESNSFNLNARTSILPPGSAMKALGTPAIENSLLALRNFKRRPRQPSMLQMVQQRPGSSRPSAIRISSDAESSDLDSNLGDIGYGDEFAPDAEGTPLKAAATNQIKSGSDDRPPDNTNANTLTQKLEAVGTKRKSDESGSSSALLQSRREKRLRSSSTAVLSSFVTAPEKISTQDDFTSDRILMSPADPATNVKVIHSSPPSSPPLHSTSPIQEHADLPHVEVLVPSSWQSRAAHELEDDADEDMADPMSSSPLQRPPKDMHSAENVDELTAQRSGKFTRSNDKKIKQRTVSTAQLQELLPRRRRIEPRVRKSTYEIPLQSDNDDDLDEAASEEVEDEIHTRSLPRARRGTMSARTARNRPTAAKPQTRLSPVKKTARPLRGAKIGKTYGKKTTRGKENDEAYDSPMDEADESTVPDISLSMQEVSNSRELEEAKLKFEDIDNWDMEFESFSGDGHRSSSVGWR